MELTGQSPQRGIRTTQMVAARSRIAQLISVGLLHCTTASDSDCKYGSYRISASFREPNTRSSTLAMFPSSSGCLFPWQRSKIALAMYCPTPGRASIFSLVRGNLPFFSAIVVARYLKVAALRFHSPIGRMTSPISASVARANSRHEGYRSMNVSKNSATVSALVRCSNSSEITTWYLDADCLRQGKCLPFLVYQISNFRRKSNSLFRSMGRIRFLLLTFELLMPL